mgnify:CR=1 FL=1|jgi:glycosyltransferase involved in cell wall biosynthesis
MYSIIRIVFEFPPCIGGSISHILELSKTINSHLTSQVILAPNYPGGKDFDVSFSIPIIRINYSRVLWFLTKKNVLFSYSILLFFYANSVVKEIQNLIKSNNNNNIVIHVHGWFLGIFVVFALKIRHILLPVVVMQHGGYKDVTNKFKKINKLLVDLYRPNSYLLLNDGTEMSDFITILDDKQIPYRVVYHGIDTVYFKPSMKKSNNNIFTILFPHRLVPFKRPDLALKIYKVFLDKLSIQNKTKLIITTIDNKSGANIDKELVAFILNNNLTDEVEIVSGVNYFNVRELINKSDVVIGTSIISNMNRSITEAMACEKAVIVFGSGETSELIINGENGLVVESGNINEFVDALIQLYKNRELRNDLGKRARITVINKRSWQSRINVELDVYKAVIKELSKT